jgi:hypothetical protein
LHERATSKAKRKSERKKEGEMSNVTSFLMGFSASSVLFCIAIGTFYLRARRRVAAIKEAIKTHQQATRVISRACDRVYPSSLS